MLRHRRIGTLSLVWSEWSFLLVVWQSPGEKLERIFGNSRSNSQNLDEEVALQSVGNGRLLSRFPLEDNVPAVLGKPLWETVRTL